MNIPERTIPGYNPSLLSFGHLIRALRTLREMKIVELAEASGLSREVIKKIEDGKSNPKLTTLLALAKGLNVDPTYLLAEICNHQDFNYFLRHFAIHEPEGFPKTEQT